MMTDLAPMVERKKQLHDRKDVLSQELSSINKELDDVDGAIMTRMKDGKLDKITCGGMTVFIQEKARASYDPERFEDIMEWAVKNHYAWIFQRRFSDAKVESLVNDGVELPPGLNVEPYSVVSHRRT